MERRLARPKQPPRRPRASAKDVLGEVEQNIKIPRKWAPFYRKLLAMRNALRAHKRGLVEDAVVQSEDNSLHMGDLGTDEYDSSFALSRVSADQNMLFEVNAAMARIKTGSYGICELTGKPIPKARLEAVPWTRFTAEAEKQLEKNGQVSRARLGERKRVRERDDGSRANKEIELNI